MGCDDQKDMIGGSGKTTPKSSRIAAKSKRMKMKTFRLVRNEDVSGVSGTGVVAEGVEFVNGMVALSWFGSHSCVNTYTSMRTVEEVHGHNGATKVEWVDA